MKSYLGGNGISGYLICCSIDRSVADAEFMVDSSSALDFPVRNFLSNASEPQRITLFRLLLCPRVGNSLFSFDAVVVDQYFKSLPDPSRSIGPKSVCGPSSFLPTLIDESSQSYRRCKLGEYELGSDILNPHSC